eukprot:4150001-Ditylum_brightwellii.AAC.1
MAMGLKIAPNEAQAIIEEVLLGLDVEVYIDDISIFSTNYDEHLELVMKVLKCLQDSNLKVNQLKCKWAIKETDFLGSWLMPTGICPWKKKVEVVLKMQPPQNMTQLRSFIRAATLYRTMWPRRSHVLTPLTNLMGKTRFAWEKEHQEVFEVMKSIMVTDALMAYPNHNLSFQVYTDASDYQMGAVIMQD